MDRAAFRVSGLHCIIGGNAPAGRHKTGYNGIHSLRAPGQRRSLFVPDFAGLNLEHYFDGFHDRADKERYFEPRRAAMRFERLSSRSALLYQPATPLWGVESWSTFTLCEPHHVDMEFRCMPRKRAFAGGCLGAFWASYIDKPESKAIHFRGRSSASSRPRMLSFESLRHGEKSSVARVGDNLRLPISPSVEAFMYASMSPLQYEKPYYYGMCRGCMFLLMFDCEHVLRFAHSPSGGGHGNPAWDFCMLVPGYVVGRQYRLKVRLCCKPFISARDAGAEFAAWKRSLQPA
jgi:hypothetical protein